MPSEDARLHPLSVLVGVPLVQIVRIVVLPLVAALLGGSERGRTVVASAVALGLLLALVVRVLSWRRFTWSFDGEVIRVEQGVISRSRRVVGVDRIQQVELDRPFVQRLLGVATLRIETAGSDAGPEVELRVLGLADALALREALQPAASDEAGTTVTASAATEPEVVLRLTLGRVGLASVTGAQLLIAPALLAGLLQFAGDRVDELIDAGIEWLFALQSGAAAPDSRTWLIGALAVVVVAVATTLVVSIVRDGGFVALRVGDDLVLRRGLLGTRESTVPLRRVQVVRMSANPLRRALGVASVRIHSAGGSAGASSSASGGGERRAIIPLVREDEVARLLSDLLGLDVLPALRGHPVAARRRALLRHMSWEAGWFVPATVVWVLLATLPAATLEASPLPLPDPVLALLARDGAAWTVPLAVGAVLLGLQAMLARLEHAALAHAYDTHVVIARSGTFTRTLSVAPLARLQGVTQRASWFQSRRGLATVRAHVAGPGGDVVVLDADEGDAARLQGVLAAASSG
jgi:putative membrane protein